MLLLSLALPDLYFSPLPDSFTSSLLNCLWLLLLSIFLLSPPSSIVPLLVYSTNQILPTLTYFCSYSWGWNHSSFYTWWYFPPYPLQYILLPPLCNLSGRFLRPLFFHVIFLFKIKYFPLPYLHPRSKTPFCSWLQTWTISISFDSLWVQILHLFLHFCHHKGKHKNLKQNAWKGSPLEVTILEEFYAFLLSLKPNLHKVFYDF